MSIEKAEEPFPFKKSIFILAFLSLLAGGAIYLLLRPGMIRFLSWLDTFGLNTLVEFVKIHCKQSYQSVPAWVVFSLPNGLWAFSYTLIILHIWLDHNSVVKYLWFVSIPVVGMGHETLQYLRVIPGTFCVVDLTLCAAGILVAVITAHLIGRRPLK